MVKSYLEVLEVEVGLLFEDLELAMNLYRITPLFILNIGLRLGSINMVFLLS